MDRATTLWTAAGIPVGILLAFALSPPLGPSLGCSGGEGRSAQAAARGTPSPAQPHHAILETTGCRSDDNLRIWI